MLGSILFKIMVVGWCFLILFIMCLFECNMWLLKFFNVKKFIKICVIFFLFFMIRIWLLDCISYFL